MEKISELRKTVGEHYFMAQMMLEFTPPDKIRLDPGMIQLYDADFDYINCKIDQWRITGAAMYWDPALGHKNTDSSVCAIIFRDDKSHNIFLHDMLYMVVPNE